MIALFFSGSPKNEAGPVIEKMHPILYDSAAKTEVLTRKIVTSNAIGKTAKRNVFSFRFLLIVSPPFVLKG